MPFVFYNPNPKGIRVGDCAVRAVSKAIGRDWTDTYIELCSEGLIFRDMPNSNYVWGMLLKKYGFEEKNLPSVCPNCTTVREFAKTHKNGRYVLACQNHVVCVINGDYYDSFDSGDETVLYFYEKEI